MMRVMRFILSNLITLLISLALAILIWINALQVEDPIRQDVLSVPVTFTGAPDNAVLVSPSNAENQNVQLVIEGAFSVVTELTAADFTAAVDLSQVPLGTEVSVPIEVQSRVPRVDILSQSPDRIPLHLEQMVTRDIPVSLDVRGDVARGHVQGEPLIDPQAITVSGPASSVELLDFARATVFLNNDRETVVDSRQPIFYDRQGRVSSVRGLTLSDEQVDITVPVSESAGFAEKFIDVDVAGTPAPGYRVLNITVSPPSVLVQGRPTALGQLTRVQTEPIDITGLTESHRQQVTLALPEGITVDETEEIFVDIEIEPFFTTDTFNSPVEVRGLEENLAAETDPDSVRVVLFGPLPVLEALADEEVNVTVDLFGLFTGTYSLEPDVDFPDRGIELRSVQPSLVTVVITPVLTATNGVTGTIPVTETNSLSAPGETSAVHENNHTSAPVGLLTLPPLHLPKREIL